VAREAARAGDRDRARELLDLVTRQLAAESAAEPETLVEMIAALTVLGEHERARRLAGTITDRYWQTQALTTIGVAEARAGRADRGEALVREIQDPDDRARALARVADAATDTDVTARLVVELMTGSAWHEAAGLAARLAGAGIAEVIDTVLAQDEDAGR
jgi:hypothetical protein